MQNVSVTICQIVKQIFCLSSGPFYVHSLWTYATRALPTQTLEGIKLQALFLPKFAQHIWREGYILSSNGVETPCELWTFLIVSYFTWKVKFYWSSCWYYSTIWRSQEGKWEMEAKVLVNMSATRCQWDYLPVSLESLQMQYVKNEQLLKS